MLWWNFKCQLSCLLLLDTWLIRCLSNAFKLANLCLSHVDSTVPLKNYQKSTINSLSLCQCVCVCVFWYIMCVCVYVCEHVHVSVCVCVCVCVSVQPCGFHFFFSVSVTSIQDSHTVDNSYSWPMSIRNGLYQYHVLFCPDTKPYIEWGDPLMKQDTNHCQNSLTGLQTELRC